MTCEIRKFLQTIQIGIKLPKSVLTQPCEISWRKRDVSLFVSSLKVVFVNRLSAANVGAEKIIEALKEKHFKYASL
jgi:hypothetical protein